MSRRTTASQKAKPRKRTKKTLRITKVPVVHTYYKLEPAVKYPDDTCGMTYTGANRRIEISVTQDEPMSWAMTFWHEWFHGVHNELGWSDDFYNEAKIEGLAHAVMSFITDPHGRDLLRNMLKCVPEKS